MSAFVYRENTSLLVCSSTKNASSVAYLFFRRIFFVEGPRFTSPIEVQSFQRRLCVHWEASHMLTAELDDEECQPKSCENRISFPSTTCNYHSPWKIRVSQKECSSFQPLIFRGDGTISLIPVCNYWALYLFLCVGIPLNICKYCVSIYVQFVCIIISI